MGYKRAKERNKRLKKLYNETRYDMGSGGVYYSPKKRRLVKYSYSRKSKAPKYYKTLSNRAIRKLKLEELGKSPAEYKRYFDYWWNLF